jgi:LDH2 family malate/lactate/ureidoglycolate dehydrogenase
VLKEGVATMVIDADQSLGQISSRFAMQQAINKALLAGIGWVNVVNSNHHGALAYYALMAAEQEMIGIVSTTTSANMAPWGSREPLVGNNPLAIAVPCNDHEPLVLDMATSLLANGRVRLARERGEPVPEGLSIDAQGNPNADPDRSAALLPAGSYKGSGLAMMLGILTGVLAGAPFTGYPGGRDSGEASELSHLMLALNIEQFTELEDFKDSTDQIIESWQTSAPRPGFDQVYVPGEIEWRRVPDREADGIPVNGALAAKLSEIAKELELDWPPGG